MINSPEMTAILKVVQKYTKTPVIFSNQDADRPISDYISMYLIDEMPIGYAEQIGDTLIKQFDLQVCFDCIGKNPYQLSNNLSMIWEIPNVQAELKVNSIAWHKSYNIKNTTILYDEKYQNRLTQEVSFYINKSTKIEIETIERVNYGFNK